MKKIIKTITVTLIILTLCLSMFAHLICSAASTQLIFNKHSVNIGETFTINVTISGGEAMYATEAFISYDSNLLEFTEGNMCNIVGGAIKIIGTPGGSKSQTYTVNFKAKAEGTSNISLYNVSYVGDTEKTITGQSAKVTIKKPATTSSAVTPSSSETNNTASNNEPSTNAKLSGLTVDGAELTPAFSANQTGYTAKVEYSTTEITVSAKAADANAKVTGTGKYPLDVGNNKISITVTAADGTTKQTYSITVTRLNEGESLTGDTPDDSNSAFFKPIINGKNHKLEIDISSFQIPIGFTAITKNINDTDIGLLTDVNNKYEVFLLTNEITGVSEYFTLNDDNTFERLRYISINGQLYIIEPTKNDIIIPSGYYETSLTVNTVTFKAYASHNTQLADMYILYCYHNGTTRFYRYDKLEGTIQRAPDFIAHTKNTISVDISDNKTFKDYFSDLFITGKIVIIAAALAVLCLIALIILLIIKSKTQKALMPPSLNEEFSENFNQGELGFTFDE